MQTPAPVDYARAHSVEEALELLERYGPESRLIAGGHSLIPMMRLRIAQPERVIDINDLTELDYIRLVASSPPTGVRHYLAIGAMTRHRSMLASAVIGEHYKILHDAENGHRRPDRPQSRHHRRLAVPGRSRRRPVRGRRGPAGRRRAAIQRRVADRSGPRIHRRPLRHRARRRGDAGRGADPDPPRRRAAPTRRWSDAPATGRSPRPAPTWCSTATRSPTSASGWPRSAPIMAAPRTPRSTCAGRTYRRHDRRGRPAGRRMQQSERRPARPGHLQEAPRRRTHPPGAPPRRRPRRLATQEGTDMQVHITVNGVEHTDEVEGRTAARALSARHVAAHRNPLGMRHLAVRNVRRLAGRGTGQDLHRAGRDGRRAPGAHRRGPGGRRQARPGARGLHERTRPAVRVLHARA